MKELGLVLLCIGPGEGPSHPLHGIFPRRLMTADLRGQRFVSRASYFYSAVIHWRSSVLTLMPSLAPSCRYGMMEWFQRSMNHCLNSATETGHDRKKQGPVGGDSLFIHWLSSIQPPPFSLPLTYEEVWCAVLLQKSVQVVPELRDPVQNMKESTALCWIHLLVLVGLYSFSVQVS